MDRGRMAHLGILLVLFLRAALVAQEIPPAVTPASVAIPIPEIPLHSERVTTQLRGIEKNLTPSSAENQIEEKLPAMVARIDELERATVDASGGSLSSGKLADLLTQGETLDDQLRTWTEAVRATAMRLDSDLHSLSASLAAWTETGAAASASGIPAALRAQVRENVEKLSEADARLRQRRRSALLLQTKVAGERARVEASLDRLTETRRATAWGMLVPEGPAIWSGAHPLYQWRAALPRVDEVLTAAREQMYQYVAEEASHALRHLFFLFFVLALLLYGRARFPQWSAQDPSLDRLAAVFHRPVSAAIVVGLAFVWWFQPYAPRSLMLALALVALVPIVRVAMSLTPRALDPVIVLFAVAFLLERVRQAVAVNARLEQVTFFLEIPAMAALAAFAALRIHAAATLPVHHRLARVLRFVVLPLLGVAFLGATLGYTDLADGVFTVVFRGANVAYLFWLSLRVAETVLAVLLRSWPLFLLRMVRRHRSLIESRCRELMRWGFIGFWAWFVLQISGFDDPVGNALGAILNATFTYGEFSVSLADAVALSLAIWASFLLSRFFRFVLEEDVFPRVHLESGLPYALSKLANYAILLIGFYVAMALIGLDMNRFTVLVGAFGVGIGFGLQNVVNNFVSGLILLFERPVRLGDRVQIGELGGEIRRIGFRSSTLRTWEGAEVIVPNGQLISDVVTNWTLSDRLRRLDLKVGVAYGTDPQRVLDLLLGIARSHELVVADPEPSALFLGFGDSSLDFELRAFTDRAEQWFQIRSDLNVAINAALAEAGITIPFPQRDLHMHNAGPVDVRLVGGTPPDRRGDRSE